MTYDDIEAARAPFERRHMAPVRRALEQQGEALAQAIEEQRFPLMLSLDREPMQEALSALWTAVIVRFASLSADEVAAMKRDVPDEWQETVQAFLDSQGGQMIALIDETTVAAVREVLMEGLEQGWGVGQIASELRDVWPDLSATRAERIVRTEVIRASNYGSLEGARTTAQAAGLTLEKVWLATPDSRTRDSHASADGQRVPLNGTFTVGGYSAEYPGDPNLPPEESVMCRCSLYYESTAKSWKAERDERLRQEYEAAKAEHPHWAQAVDAVAENAGLAFDTVRKIVHSGP